jgi:hypothetical protein
LTKINNLLLTDENFNVIKMSGESFSSFINKTIEHYKANVLIQGDDNDKKHKGDSTPYNNKTSSE